MNSFQTRDRSTFVEQKPHRAPWLAICILSATTAFLAGHILWNEHSKTASGAAQPFAQTTPHEIAMPKILGHKLPGKPFVNETSENPIADIVASVGPAVVSIDTTIHGKSSTTSGLDLPDLLFSKPGHPLFHDPEHYEAHGSGSGVVIRSDGYILTNNHVVKGADDIKITLTNNRTFKGRVIGRDAYDDVALVKIDADNLPSAKLGSSKSIRPGDWAIAIGSPLGLSHTVTAGIISAVGRSLSDLNNNIDLIQTDAAINPGNSGGPLLNIRGEVIGINMAIRTDAQNIGFSIPIDVARDSANSILTHEPIARPYLGISMIDFDPQLADAIGLPTKLHGVLVSKVVRGGSAASSGISEGDIIERVNDVPVATGGDVQRIVRVHRVGSSIKLELFHAGRQRDISVILRAYPAEAS